MRLSPRIAVPLLAALLLAPAPLAAQDAQPGKGEYDRWCAGCHGEDGKGEGPGAATMMPRPRDFTTGRYQIRSTPSGALPTDEDMTRVILDGMPGTAMPGWRDHFGDSEVRDLVAYLKTFSPFFGSQPAPEPVQTPSAPGVDEAALAGLCEHILGGGVQRIEVFAGMGRDELAADEEPVAFSESRIR